MKKIFKCKFCDKESTSSGTISYHQPRCENNPNRISSNTDMKIIPVDCPHCKETFKNLRAMKMHEKFCDSNPNMVRKNKPVDDNKICCVGCKRVYLAKNLNSHIEKCYYMDGRERAIKMGNKWARINRPPMYMKVNLTEEEKKDPQSAMMKRWRSDPKNKQRLCEIAQKAYRDNPEYRLALQKRGGRCKTYEHNDLFLQGTWELSVAKSMDLENIDYTNRLKPFEYEWKNGVHLYYPDFYLPKYDLYIEVKGYEVERDHAKWKAVPNLVVLRQPEINRIKKGESILSVANLENL